MKFAEGRYRVAIIGASSLLGKEVVAVLEEREFPVSRLVSFEADLEEPELPIVDLHGSLETALMDEEVAATDLDFVFLAARPRELPLFLRPLTGLASDYLGHCVVIDMADGLAQRPEGPRPVLRIPFLERSDAPPEAARTSNHYVAAHPATIVLSSLLLRLAARFALKSAVAQVFLPTSEIGPRGIEELQKQTVNLLSFQKIPRAIFGAQLAFNLLPRLGRTHTHALADLESRIRTQLRAYLGSRVPLPALHVVQTPVFYALAVSLYLETVEPVGPEALGAALAGERIHLHRLSQQAPSQVEAAGSSNILVDALSLDPEHPGGVWVWAAVDNIRLAAVNAIEIAESLVASGSGQPPRHQRTREAV